MFPIQVQYASKYVVAQLFKILKKYTNTHAADSALHCFTARTYKINSNANFSRHLPNGIKPIGMNVNIICHLEKYL